MKEENEIRHRVRKRHERMNQEKIRDQKILQIKRDKELSKRILSLAGSLLKLKEVGKGEMIAKRKNQSLKSDMLSKKSQTRSILNEEYMKTLKHKTKKENDPRKSFFLTQQTFEEIPKRKLKSKRVTYAEKNQYGKQEKPKTFVSINHSLRAADHAINLALDALKH
eukprot:snap_masked-scaffold_53-processed-gene-1.83-mRNA-1 protein AED:1.00 eAED:1.00 QI:0/-1/0/0/-1/1/1/0/165